LSETEEWQGNLYRCFNLLVSERLNQLTSSKEEKNKLDKVNRCSKDTAHRAMLQQISGSEYLGCIWTALTNKLTSWQQTSITQTVKWQGWQKILTRLRYLFDIVYFLAFKSQCYSLWYRLDWLLNTILPK